MGTAVEMKCKQCGHKWLLLEGKGLSQEDQPVEAARVPDEAAPAVCPVCGSEDIEPDNDLHILWD